MAPEPKPQLEIPPPSADPARWALFLDFDGTLVDIAVTPRSIIIPPNLPELLERLRNRLGGALAIVSGRPIAEIDKFLSPFISPAAGLHGLDMRLPRGAAIGHGLAKPIDELREPARLLVAALPGTVLEDKGATLAFHYRMAPAHAKALQAGVMALIAQRPDLGLMPGKMVLEVKPRRVDKGSAVRQLMEYEPFSGRIPVFLGDDITDQYGFVAAQELGGHAIVVGNTPFASPWFTFPNPATARAWLASLAGDLGDAQSDGAAA